MLHLRHYPEEPDGVVVLRKLHVIKDKDLDGNPIERTVTDAHFKIAVDGNEIVNLSLGNGIERWPGLSEQGSATVKWIVCRVPCLANMGRHAGRA